MSWSNHISNIVSKANRTLSFLRRNLKISSKTIKERSYKVFVRPLLDYASAVWDPYTQKNIDRLEAVQRRAARFVLGRYHNTSSVSRLIRQLGWPSLEQRRREARLSIFRKIQRDEIRCPEIKRKLVLPPKRQRRTHSQQFCQITSRTQYRGGSFLPRTVRDWNRQTIQSLEAIMAKDLCQTPPTDISMPQ